MNFDEAIRDLKKLLPDVEGDEFKWSAAAAILVKRYKQNEKDKSSALQLTDSLEVHDAESKTEGFFPSLTVNSVFRFERLQIPLRVHGGNLALLSGKKVASGQKAQFEDDSLFVRRRPPLNEGKNPSIQLTGGPSKVRALLDAEDVFVFIRKAGTPTVYVFGLRRKAVKGTVLDVPAHATAASGDATLVEKEVVYVFNRLAAAEPVAPSEKPSAQVDALVRLLKQFHNVIVEGVPGTGKTWIVSQIARHWETMTGRPIAGLAEGSPVPGITLHPSTSYEEFVEGIRPARLEADGAAASWYTEDAPVNAEGRFSIVDGFFLEACRRASEEPLMDHLVLLDELNRANVPRVMGDLLTTIESSKRLRYVGGSWDHTESTVVVLPYSGRKFAVPENLYVIATLNTSDRSVSPLDAALRRRFAFSRLEPVDKAELLGLAAGKPWEAPYSASVTSWSDLNEVLLAQLGMDAVLGHSYLFDLARSLASVASSEYEAVVGNAWHSAILPQLVDILATHSAEAMVSGDESDARGAESAIGKALASTRPLPGFALLVGQTGAGLHRRLTISMQPAPEK